MNYSINDDAVCKAAPGFTWVCLKQKKTQSKNNPIGCYALYWYRLDVLVAPVIHEKDRNLLVSPGFHHPQKGPI